MILTRHIGYFLYTTNLQHRVFLAQFSCNILDNFAKSPICFLFVIPAKAGITDKFSFILRVLRGYICFGCGYAALCTMWFCFYQ